MATNIELLQNKVTKIKESSAVQAVCKLEICLKTHIRI